MVLSLAHLVSWRGHLLHCFHTCHIHQHSPAYLRQWRGGKGLITFLLFLWASHWHMKLPHEPWRTIACSIFNWHSCSLCPRQRFDMELNSLKLNDENIHILRVPMPLYNFSKPPSSWVSFCCSVKQGQEWYFPRCLWEWVCGGVGGVGRELWSILHKGSCIWKRHSLHSQGAVRRTIDLQSMLESVFHFPTFVTC